MKKYIITTIILIFFFSLISCEKYHRNRYTGHWDFTTVRFIPGTAIDTTYYFGEIIVGRYENEIIIRYTEDDEITAGVDEEGFIYNSTLEYSGKYPFGQFNGKNNLSFRIISEESWTVDTIIKIKVNAIKKSKK